MVFLLAALATAAAVLAPAYSRAAQQSVLSDRLAAAPSNATGVQVRSDPAPGETPPIESTEEAKLELHQILLRRSTLRERLDSPVGGSDVETVMTPRGTDGVLARLAYRDAACTHLTMTAGQCADANGTVIVSARSAAANKITVGQTLTPRGRLAGATPSRHPLTVVGLYTPKDPADPYWGRGGYFAAGAPEGESALPRIDAVFVGDEDDLTLPGALPSVYLDYRLRTADVGLDDVGALRSELAGFTTDINAAQMQISTALSSVLDDIDTETAALGRTVPVVAVPLVLVCWFVLFLLVAALADERSPELALAKLRGYSGRQAARFGRGEAWWLVGLAAPVGILAGVGVVEVAARTMLGPNVHVELRWPVFVAAAIGVAAALLAVRVASSRTVSQPVLALLRRVPERGRWRAGIVEGVILALAAASLVAAASDQTAPLALLAPALLALVAGIVTARLLALWSRLRVRRYARRGRVSGMLAHAQLARRPIGHQIMLVVTVAVALFSFAATAWDVAAQARGDVAADTVGADRVLQVGAADPASLMAAVAAVDPDGTAMPVVRVSERYGDQRVELLGVRTEALPTVAVWRGHTRQQVGQLADLLRPDRVAPLAIERSIEVDAAASGIQGGPYLAAVVAPPGTPARTVGLGPLANGRHRYRADLAGCTAGCRLLALAVVRPTPSTEPVGAHLRIDAVTTSTGAVNTSFSAAGRWRASSTRAPRATVKVESGSSLTVDLSSTDPGDVVIEYLDSPDALPVALAGPTPADDAAAGDFTFPALGESPQRFAVVDRERALPRVGSRALLFDLDYAVRSAQRTSSLSDNSRLHYEVWANGQAPADLGPRLAAAGLQVLGEQSIAAERDRMGRAAPALGLRLYLIAGAAAVLLAVGAVLLTAYIGAGGRRYEMAALRVAGVRPGTLRRGLLREYLHLTGLPLVVGLLAGVAAAALMLPGIPLVTVGTATGEIEYTPGLGALPAAVAATLVGLFVALLAVLRQVGRATPDHIREGSQL